ncbi:MAG: hypothetical protein WBQ44_02005, partial [Rhodococcus sp. (in: high G+C Gram-positive bacteria)]
MDGFALADHPVVPVPVPVSVPVLVLVSVGFGQRRSGWRLTRRNPTRRLGSRMLTSVIVSVLPLAVVDAVGVGALAMPVWFLLSDRARTGYICLYLTIL